MSASSSHSRSSASLRYGPVAMGLHWVLAIGIFAMFGLGLYMADLPFSPWRLKLYNWHKWAGVTVLLLSAMRLLWRLSHRPPALPQAVVLAMPSWQVRAHHATHFLLYGLFFAVPLLGWAYSSAAGFPIVWLGQLALPDLLPKNEAIADLIKPLHGYAAWALMALVALHIAAALKHHFVDRDGLLTRMLPGRASN